MLNQTTLSCFNHTQSIIFFALLIFQVRESLQEVLGEHVNILNYLYKVGNLKSIFKCFFSRVRWNTLLLSWSCALDFSPFISSKQLFTEFSTFKVILMAYQQVSLHTFYENVNLNQHKKSQVIP